MFNNLTIFITFSITTLSIMDLIAAISINDTQHNGLNCDNKHKRHSA
jgi:hypothetical protein